jgi:hypothetical protein
VGVDPITGAVVRDDATDGPLPDWWYSVSDAALPRVCQDEDAHSFSPEPARLTESRTYYIRRIRLEPPPPDADPAIGAEEALRRLDFPRETQGDWELLLAVYSADFPANGLTNEPYYTGRLAWVLVGNRVGGPVFHSGPVLPDDAPPRTPEAGCLWHFEITGIDADTGTGFGTHISG